MKTTRTNIDYDSFVKNSEYLTVDNVKDILGKKVYWTHPVADGNAKCVFKSELAKVISMYDQAASIPEAKYGTRQAMWNAELAKERIDEFKNTLTIIDSDGEDTCIRLYPGEKEFTCSDADRLVYFRLCE